MQRSNVSGMGQRREEDKTSIAIDQSRTYSTSSPALADESPSIITTCVLRAIGFNAMKLVGRIILQRVVVTILLGFGALRNCTALREQNLSYACRFVLRVERRDAFVTVGRANTIILARRWKCSECSVPIEDEEQRSLFQIHP